MGGPHPGGTQLGVMQADVLWVQTGDWGLGTGDWELPAGAPICGCWQCGIICVSSLLDVSAVMRT